MKRIYIVGASILFFSFFYWLVGESLLNKFLLHRCLSNESKQIEKIYKEIQFLKQNNNLDEARKKFERLTEEQRELTVKFSKSRSWNLDEEIINENSVCFKLYR
jgi:hypothetical protein